MASAKASAVPSQSHPAVHTRPRRLRHHRPSRHTCQGSWMVGRGAPLHEGEVQQNLSRRAREGGEGGDCARGGGGSAVHDALVGCRWWWWGVSACGGVHDALEVGGYDALVGCR